MRLRLKSFTESQPLYRFPFPCFKIVFFYPAPFSQSLHFLYATSLQSLCNFKFHQATTPLSLLFSLFQLFRKPSTLVTQNLLLQLRPKSFTEPHLPIVSLFPVPMLWFSLSPYIIKFHWFPSISTDFSCSWNLFITRINLANLETLASFCSTVNSDFCCFCEIILQNLFLLTFSLIVILISLSLITLSLCTFKIPIFTFRFKFSSFHQVEFDFSLQDFFSDFHLISLSLGTVPNQFISFLKAFF